jgi:hypothetical protein
VALEELGVRVDRREWFVSWNIEHAILGLISICESLFLEPRPHAERVYADAKQVCWNKAKL